MSWRSSRPALYGKPMPKQNGAPLRLAVPWKYGFKSIKSVVRLTFTDQRPVSFWEEIQASEYGFWANVNPEVPHPRWSQAKETPLAAQRRCLPYCSTAMRSSWPIFMWEWRTSRYSCDLACECG